MDYREQIISGPAAIHIEVKTAAPMEWVLEDTTFLDYRLGKVERTHEITRDRVDLVWDRSAAQKTAQFRDDQLCLTGGWAEGEIQRLLVTLLARRMEEKDVYLFHSSCVHYRGENILFVGGESNSGKTMAQIEVRRRGGEFIATETTVVERATMLVIAGSQAVFLVKRAKGTERADKPSQNAGVEKLFGGVLPDLEVFYKRPVKIDRVIVPDIDGHFDLSTVALGEYEKAYQTFHSLVNYMGLHILLAPGLPMPIMDSEELRYKRAAFIEEFKQKPYHLIRAKTPQLLIDEVERLLEAGG